MSTLTRISFAIPTYNFGPYLAVTVHSIYKGAQQLKPEDIEVVIVDGASSDKTEQVVSQLCLEYPHLRYERMPKRGGIDFDLNHAVSQCTSEYIWLLSADDLLVPAWDAVIWPVLSKHQPQLALVPAVLCSANMQPLRPHHVFQMAQDESLQIFSLESQDALHEYLRRAKTLEALFSYMSAVIVRREVWEALPERSDYYGSCWAHCARLMPLLVQQGHYSTRLIYFNQFLLRKRTGNDSFLAQGLIKRIGISVLGWTRLAEEFFPVKLRDAVYRLLYLDSSWLNFAYARLGASTSEQGKQLIEMAELVYRKGKGDHLTTTWLIALLKLVPVSPTLQRYLAGSVPFISYWRHRLKGWLLR